MTDEVLTLDQEFLRMQKLGFTQKAAFTAARLGGFTFGTNAGRALWQRLKPNASPAPALAEPCAIGEEEKPLFGGILPAPDVFRRRLDGRRFVFTCAQNNTKLHDVWWESLLHFCERNGAQLGVSKISYNKSGWQKVTTESEGLWYDKRILPYVVDEQVKIADRLVFCGELDILPTAGFPLSGLDNYTGSNSAIIPHSKMQLQSFATMKHEPAKMLYTTGAVTMRNYIDRRAGQIASYHHIYGAVYVEVDAEGDWFVRQLNADDAGVFYDLDRVYGPGYDHSASDLGRPYVNLGDIHVAKLNPENLSGAMDMLLDLDPKGVFIHDLIDFEARNHHNKKDPLFLVEQQFQRSPSVEHEMVQAVRFLHGLQVSMPNTTLYVIRSNHDEAFKRWLSEGSGFLDPVNLRYWHEMNAVYLRAVEKNIKLDIFAKAMSIAAYDAGVNIDNVQFIQEDQSLVFNGIEYGMHGHLGPNGAKGSPRALRQIGRRANTGHTHSASIVDGVWTAGVLADLDMGYNKGPSSWSVSHVITYPNAKRTIVTQIGKKWRAQ